MGTVRAKKRQAPVPVSGKPFMVVGGMRPEITGVEFRNGKMYIVAKGHGPSPEITGYTAIFGSDGRGIFQIPHEVRIPALRSCDPVTLDQPIVFETIVPTGERDVICDWR
jgi:hypothetical protein